MSPSISAPSGPVTYSKFKGRIRSLRSWNGSKIERVVTFISKYQYESDDSFWGTLYWCDGELEQDVDLEKLAFERFGVILEIDSDKFRGVLKEEVLDWIEDDYVQKAEEDIKCPLGDVLAVGKYHESSGTILCAGGIGKEVYEFFPDGLDFFPIASSVEGLLNQVFYPSDYLLSAIQCNKRFVSDGNYHKQWYLEEFLD